MNNEADPTPSPAPTPTEPAAPAPAAAPEPSPSSTATPQPAPELFAFDSIKLPEGFTVDDETSKSFTDIINDTKMSTQERAQALINLQTSLMNKSAQAGEQSWVDLQAQWQEQARADPVIGGDKLEPALGAISKLIDSQEPAMAAEIRQVMTLTGAGNHPVMIKFLSKIAGELSEGGPIPGNPPASEKTMAQKLFPSMK